MITLRNYQPKDFDSYYALNCDIIAEQKYFSMEEPYSKESSQDFRQQQMSAGRPMIVAFDNEKFIGWCDIFEGNEKFNPMLGIGLNENYRDKGIGKKLIQATLTACENNGIMHVYLSVFKENLRAIALYQKIGFEHIQSADSTAMHCGVMKESIVMEYVIKYKK